MGVCMSGRIGRWMDGWMDRWMTIGWMNERMDGCTIECVDDGSE